MRIEILTLARDMVGNTAEIRAEILEPIATYWRVKDIIRIEIIGGARMTEAELRTYIEGAYNG